MAVDAEVEVDEVEGSPERFSWAPMRLQPTWLASAVAACSLAIRALDLVHQRGGKTEGPWWVSVAMELLLIAAFTAMWAWLNLGVRVSSGARTQAPSRHVADPDR